MKPHFTMHIFCNRVPIWNIRIHTCGSSNRATWITRATENSTIVLLIVVSECICNSNCRSGLISVTLSCQRHWKLWICHWQNSGLSSSYPPGNLKTSIKHHNHLNAKLHGQTLNNVKWCTNIVNKRVDTIKMLFLIS